MDVDLKEKAALVTARAGGLWSEFRAFAFKGNLLDLAVAVVLGGAFGKLIDAVVKFVIMPIISYVDIGPGKSYTAWHVGRLELGKLLAELLNFTLVALAVFIVIVKVLGAVVRRATPPAPVGEPTTKECPMCLMVIPIKARRCGHCTSDLPDAAAAAAPLL